MLDEFTENALCLLNHVIIPTNQVSDEKQKLFSDLSAKLRTALSLGTESNKVNLWPGEQIWRNIPSRSDNPIFISYIFSSFLITAISSNFKKLYLMIILEKYKKLYLMIILEKYQYIILNISASSKL